MYAVSNGDGSESTVFDNKHNAAKIIGIHAYGNEILAALNDGALVSSGKDANG